VSWFSRIDRFGSGHMVRSQDLRFSCGMACIVMVNFKIKKGLMFAGMAAGAALQVVPVVGTYLGATLARTAFDYAVASEAEVYALAERAKGSPNDFNVAGVSLGLYPQVLSDLGLGTWESVNVTEGGIVQACIDSTEAGSPVILNFHGDGGFDHAVCVDETHSFLGTRYLCVCDPGDGELRLITGTPGSTVRYDGSYTPISTHRIFGGDAIGYTSGANNQGKFDGWIVRRT